MDEGDSREGRNTEVPTSSPQISGSLHAGPPPKTAAPRGRTVDGNFYLTSTPHRTLKQLLLKKPNNSLALHVASPMSRAQNRAPMAHDSWVKRYKHRRNERLISDPALKGSKKTPQPKITSNALAQSDGFWLDEMYELKTPEAEEDLEHTQS